MILTHTLGFPRMGEHRELKFALEKFWKGDITAAQLEQTGRELRARHWALQRQHGLDFVTVGDFAFYDQVANHIQLLGCEPARFGFSGKEPALTRYFMLARGVAPASSDGAACDSCNHSAGNPALEMTKWFDTNYHYLVPELHADTQFSLGSPRLFDEVREARALGYPVKAVLLGPLSFLWLSKEKGPAFARLSLLPALLAVYRQVLQELQTLGVSWVQIDEPILGLDLPHAWRDAFEPSYRSLRTDGIHTLLATYFSALQEHTALLATLDVAGWHVDAVRAAEDLQNVVTLLPADKLLSVGIIDGRNIWRSDLDLALTTLRAVLERRAGPVWIAPSCSLLHVPFTLANDLAVDPEVRGWLAGAKEKLAELELLKQVLNGNEKQVAGALFASRAAIVARRNSPRVQNPQVAQRIAGLAPEDDRRRHPFAVRQQKQRQRFALPAFPTTTIGSFPQTAQIRQARAAFKRQELTAEAYRVAMEKEIAFAVQRQEQLDLDVLVHGEAERNDMVEYFGEQLSGFTFTANGWVQSYGSRCVKPPVLFGDVTRPHPMTVNWTRYAQSLTRRPMKGMLTGPITILQWSFVRDDQPRATTALQIALAIRDEVVDLEQAGIGIIQIDEPAIREGLPLRRAAWPAYLQWATRAFRVSASGVQDETQIHTHMCYAEFNDILPEIAGMDADVITIETSRSDMELLEGFGEFNYPNEIGPGVYDIHSPRVPAAAEMVRLLQKAAAVVPPHNLWVNPDCGLKTRGWPETEAALAHMVAAAHQLRATLD
jgi:5-methyltetrahydropteroyltriglutamate--homocysteine methyltransferase